MGSFRWLLIAIIVVGLSQNLSAMRHRGSQGIRPYLNTVLVFSQVRQKHTYHSLVYEAFQDRAGRKMYIAQVAELAKEGKKDINERKEGCTSLELASSLVMPEMLEALLNNGADPQINLEWQKLTALHHLGTRNPYASVHELKDCIHLLKQGGNRITDVDLYRQTPLFTASDQAAPVLLEMGADPFWQSNQGTGVWASHKKNPYVQMYDTKNIYSDNPHWSRTRNLLTLGVMGSAGGMLISYLGTVMGGGWEIVAKSMIYLWLGSFGISMGSCLSLTFFNAVVPAKPTKIIAHTPFLEALAAGKSSRLQLLLEHYHKTKETVGENYPLYHWYEVMEANKSRYSPEVSQKLREICQGEIGKYFNEATKIDTAN